MEYRPISTDRRKLIAALHEHLDEPIQYTGFPKFMYQIGNYSVTRDGLLIAPDPDENVIRTLREEGILEDEEADTPETGIRFPVDGIPAQGLTNLVCMISARAYLLNKVLQAERFAVEPELIDRLRDMNPRTTEEFFECVLMRRGKDMIKGVAFTRHEIIFDGFPDEPEYHVLADKMISN